MFQCLHLHHENYKSDKLIKASLIGLGWKLSEIIMLIEYSRVHHNQLLIVVNIILINSNSDNKIAVLGIFFDDVERGNLFLTWFLCKELSRGGREGQIWFLALTWKVLLWCVSTGTI